MYKESQNVFGMTPPSSDGLAIGQIMGILDNFKAQANSDPLALDAENISLSDFCWS